MEFLPFVGPAISIARGIKDIADAVGKFRRADHEILRVRGELTVVKADLQDWLVLWTDVAHKPFSDAVYKYFWGTKGCAYVDTRLKLIRSGLEQLQSQLYNYKNAEQQHTIRKIKLVVSTAEDNMKRILGGLGKDISNLDATTRFKFKEILYKEKRKGDFDKDLPKQYAKLAAHSEQVWKSLNLLRSLHEKNTLLAMRSDKDCTESNKRYGRSIWTYLNGECLSSLVLDIIPRGPRASIVPGVSVQHNVSLDVGKLPHTNIAQYIHAINDNAVRNDEVIVHSSLQQCLHSLSERPQAEQKRLRHETNLDRINAAVDIAEWNLLAWDTDWTAGLCICNVYCAFNHNDPDYLSPQFSLEGRKYRENHGCFTKDIRSSRHLLLAVVLAALAIGCQIGVYYNRDSDLYFTADIDGHLQMMDEEDLLRKVVACCGGVDERWAHAIRYCLELNADRVDKSKLEPGDFHYYNDLVLKPLEEYRRCVEKSRSRRFGQGLSRTLHSVTTL